MSQPSARPATGTVPKIWKASSGPSFHRAYALDVDDHLNIQFRNREVMPAEPVLAGVALLALIASLALQFEQFRSGDIVSPALLTAATVVICVLLAMPLIRPLRQFVRRFYERKLRASEGFGSTIEFTADAYGVHTTSPGQTSSNTWDSFHTLEEEDGTFYFWLSKGWAYVLPARLFDSEKQRQALRDNVLSWSGRSFGPPVLARLGYNGRKSLPN